MKLFGKYRNVREMLEKEDTKTLQQHFPHGKPMSRRELLQAGALSFGATVTAPSILGMLAPETAKAQDGCAEVSALPGYVSMNLSGGAAMGSQMIPLTKDRQPLSSYERLGLGSTANLIGSSGVSFVADSMGAKWFSLSGIFQGLNDAVLAAPVINGKSVLDNTASIAVWSTSQNDSDNNAAALEGMITSVRQGKLLQNLGTQGNEPAGISQKPAFKAPPTPVVIGNSGDIDRALGVSGVFSSGTADSPRADGLGFTAEQKYNVARTIAHLSNEQCKKLQGANGQHELCTLLEKAAKLNTSVISATDKGTDPLSDPLVAAILDTVWTDMNNNRAAGNNLANIADGNMTRVGAFLTYNVLKGNAASASLELGGYDYHGSPDRVTTDNRDYRAGWMIGQVLSTAHIMQKALYLVVHSDGGVNGPGGNTAPGQMDFTNDYGQAGGMFCFAYDPNGRPELSDSSGTPDFQIGHYNKDGESVAGDSIVGNSIERAAMVAFINYCTFAGKPELADQVLRGTFNASQIDLATRIKKVG